MSIKIYKTRKDTYLLNKINNCIIERNLLKTYQRVLIAVSGGQDSICLLNTLYKLQNKWQWKLGIIHCDHGWHWTSKLQSAHVKNLAASIEIDYYQVAVIQAIQQEEDARNWRYHIIQNIAISHNYSAIITAHSASDRTETLIYNLIRGTGLQGIQSLSWKRKICSIQIPKILIDKTKIQQLNKLKYTKTIYGIKNSNKIQYLYIIRPFLDITRTSIKEITEYWNLPSWPDPSNQNLAIYRNRIRKQILPYIKIYYNPKIEQALARWAEVVYAETIYLEKLTNSLYAKIKMKQNFFYINTNIHSGINIRLLCSFPIALQRRILRKFITCETGQSLRFQHIEQIRLFSLFYNDDSKKKDISDSFESISSSIPVLNISAKIRLGIKKKVLCVCMKSIKKNK